MSDICVDPVEPFDPMQPDKSRHASPQWCRLSGVAGTPEAKQIIIGPWSTVDRSSDNSDATGISCNDFALQHNVSPLLLIALTRTYPIAHVGHRVHLFQADDLQALLLQYGPPSGSLSFMQARKFLGSRFKALPKPVWSLGQLRYFDPIEIYALESQKRS